MPELSAIPAGEVEFSYASARISSFPRFSRSKECRICTPSGRNRIGLGFLGRMEEQKQQQCADDGYPGGHEEEPVEVEFCWILVRRCKDRLQLSADEITCERTNA